MENIKKNYLSQFIEKNKDKIKEKQICPICGGSYDYFNKSRHNKTKKHINYYTYQIIEDEKDKLLFKLINKLKI
jgi:hypothetical protein